MNGRIGGGVKDGGTWGFDVYDETDDGREAVSFYAEKNLLQTLFLHKNIDKYMGWS